MNRPFLFFMAPIICLFSLSSAKAATITIEYQSYVMLSNEVSTFDPFSPSTTTDSQLHTFQYFDSTLGDLLSVDISIHSEYTVELEVIGQNTTIDPFADVFQATAQASADFYVNAFPGLFDAEFYGPVPTALAFETTCYGGTQGSPVGSSTCSSLYSDDELFTVFPDLLTISTDDSASPTDISAFIGTGFFNVLAELETSAILGADYAENDSGFPAGNAIVDWNSTITIAYTYAAVPIPAAVWLFGSGLIGLVGVARRKKS